VGCGHAVIRASGGEGPTTDRHTERFDRRRRAGAADPGDRPSEDLQIETDRPTAASGPAGRFMQRSVNPLIGEKMLKKQLFGASIIRSRTACSPRTATNLHRGGSWSLARHPSTPLSFQGEAHSQRPLLALSLSPSPIAPQRKNNHTPQNTIVRLLHAKTLGFFTRSHRTKRSSEVVLRCQDLP
jgi:hypothetical protein